MAHDEQLTGFQSRTDWMGESLLTLRDLWPEAPRAMIVGLNPVPCSVEVGHYHQGRSGQRQLLRMADAGLFPRPEHGSTTFETAALEAGVGFTDVVKRPAGGESGVRRAEIEFGRERLNRELERRDIPLVVCIYRHPVPVLLGEMGAPGLQQRSTSWGARVFRMPGPFAAASEVSAVMAELAQALHDH